MKQNAIKGNYLQIQKFAIDKKINVQTCSNEHIKCWIYMIKAMKRNVEEHDKGDICTFFT